MSVTKEKLEEIFKVYEDKKNSNPHTIKTNEICKDVITQQSSFDQRDYFPQRRKS